MSPKIRQFRLNGLKLINHHPTHKSVVLAGSPQIYNMSLSFLSIQFIKPFILQSDVFGLVVGIGVVGVIKAIKTFDIAIGLFIHLILGSLTNFFSFLLIGRFVDSKQFCLEAAFNSYIKNNFY